MKNFAKFVLASALILPAAGASAHHSSAPHFDSSKTVEVVAKITEVRFVNPHAYVYFTVEESGETEDWRCELTSATQLRKYGWEPTTLKEGQIVTIKGAPARREDNVCYLNSLTLANGIEIQRHSNLNEIENLHAVVEVAEAPVSSEIDLSQRPKYLQNGQPNISGAWVSKSFGRGRLGVSPEYVLTDAGRAVADEYEMEFDDPILRCHPVNIVNAWNHDVNTNEITQTDNTIHMRYGFMDFERTIHLDQDSHPENLTPSTAGHSIARWEGDTLIVDTIGFEAGILEHRDGSNHSEQMHIEERFHIDDETGYLVRDYTITDPVTLATPATGQDLQALSPTGYEPYGCVELSGDNNIRPEDQ